MTDRRRGSSQFFIGEEADGDADDDDEDYTLLLEHHRFKYHVFYLRRSIAGQ